MVKVALFVRLEAKPGKEHELENLLQSGLALVQKEPKTVTWYAIKFGPAQFGIFDTFSNDEGRDAHLSGQLATILMSKAEELLVNPPVIEKINILAAKQN